MPLAFAAGLGGIITMVGTPPNLLVSSVLGTAGLRKFGSLNLLISEFL